MDAEGRNVFTVDRYKFREEDEIKIVNGVTRPKFAHVGPAVRGKMDFNKDFDSDFPLLIRKGGEEETVWV